MPTKREIRCVPISVRIGVKLTPVNIFTIFTLF